MGTERSQVGSQSHGSGSGEAAGGGGGGGREWCPEGLKIFNFYLETNGKFRRDLPGGILVIFVF